MPESTRPVFVYGTLLHGQANHRLLCGRVASVEPAVLAGARLHAKRGAAFPYAVQTGDPEDRVVGEVVTPDPTQYAEVLRDLDRLEGYAHGEPWSLYNRVTVEITAGDGQSLPVWIYVASVTTAARIVGLPVVSGGDWRAQQMERPEVLGPEHRRRACRAGALGLEAVGTSSHP